MNQSIRISSTIFWSIENEDPIFIRWTTQWLKPHTIQGYSSQTLRNISARWSWSYLLLRNHFSTIIKLVCGVPCGRVLAEAPPYLPRRPWQVNPAEKFQQFPPNQPLIIIPLHWMMFMAVETNEENSSDFYAALKACSMSSDVRCTGCDTRQVLLIRSSL